MIGFDYVSSIEYTYIYTYIYMYVYVYVYVYVYIEKGLNYPVA